MNFYDNNLRGKRYLQLVLITLTIYELAEGT